MRAESIFNSRLIAGAIAGGASMRDSDDRRGSGRLCSDAARHDRAAGAARFGFASL